jgi:chemotaxis protein MotB
MARRRRKHEEEHENMERWLVSYADFITLLFAFFVTLYSISRVDGNKLGSAVESLQRALGSVISVQMPQGTPGVFTPSQPPVRLNLTPIQDARRASPEREIFERVAEEIRKGVQGLSGGNQTEDQIKFIIEKRGLVIRVSEPLFFRSGDASIPAEFLPTVDIVARALEKLPHHIRVEGHSDNVPINTARFPSNWELSTARATTLVRYFLTQYRFTPDRLSATGYAEYQPVDTNRTQEGRLQNRRVDFVVLNAREMESEPQPSPVHPASKETI